jgi:dihydroorotate dehydrogenase electron transfer subunit
LSTKKLYKARVKNGSEKIAESTYALDIDCGEMIDAVPGQFANIYTGRKDLLLPRPLGIYSNDGGVLRFVFKVLGEGTEFLSTKKSNDEITIIAPLGNGFPPLPENARVALVSGGMGLVPLSFLVHFYAGKSTNFTLLAGFRTKSEIWGLEQLKTLKTDVYAATDDGSFGIKGTSVDLLENSAQKFDVIYACGPKPMLEATAKVARKKNKECFVSLEERMGCGFGVCVGCTCKTLHGYKKVCADGPVFNSQEIFVASE